MRKEEFKSLLDQLLEKELERLRKKFRPYKRRAFLRNKVIVDIDLKYKDKNTLGYYTNSKETKYKYIHKIYITKTALDDYKHWIKLKIPYYKRHAISQLSRIIRHELMHAFVKEEFDDWNWEDIENINSDYSPIFLSCLYWGNGNTGHKYTSKFLKSELYSKIKQCKKYDSVQNVLFEYILEFEKILRKINNNKEIHNVKSLKLSFNDKGAGFKKKIYVKAYVKYKENGNFKRGTTQLMTLGIGFLVTPIKVLENYKRIFDNGVIAHTHVEEVLYANVKDEGFKKPIIIFEK